MDRYLANGGGVLLGNRAKKQVLIGLKSAKLMGQEPKNESRH